MNIQTLLVSSLAGLYRNKVTPITNSKTQPYFEKLNLFRPTITDINKTGIGLLALPTTLK